MSSTLFILTFSAVIQVIIPVPQGVFKSHQVVQEVEDMFYYDDLDVYPDTGSLQSKDLFVKFVKKYHKKYSSKDEIKLRYELFKLKLLRDGGDYDENTDLTKKELEKYHSKYSTQSITTEVMNKTDTTENVKSTDHPSTSTHRYDEPSITTKTTTEVENSTQSTTTVKFGITEVMNTTNTTENANSSAYPSTSAHGHDDPSDIVETETGRPDETSTKSLDDNQSTQNETSLKNTLLSTEKTNESVSNITQNVISRMSKDENEHVTESKSTNANNDACIIKYESGTFNSSSTTPNITQRNEGIQIIFNNSSIIFNIQRDVILYPYFDDYIKKFIYNMSTAKTFDSIPPTNESTKQFCTVTKTETTDNKNVAKPITDMIDKKESNLEIHTIVDKDVLNDVTEQSGPKKSTTSNQIKFKGRKVDILEPLDILTEITDITESSVLDKIYRTASITNNTKFTTDNVNDQEFKSPKSENTLTTKLSGSSPTIIHISNTKQIDVESTLYDAKIDTQKTQAKLVPITDRASGSIESDTGITKVTSPTIIKTEPTFGTTESYSEIEHEISTELPSINEFRTGSIKPTTEGTQFSKNIITIIDPVTRVIEEMTAEKSGFKKPITLNTTEFESHQTNLSEAMTNKTDVTHPTEIPTTITETTESHRTAAMTNKTEMTFDYRTNKAIKDSTHDQPHTLKPSGTTPTIIDITQTEPIDVGHTVYHGKMNENKTQTELVPITDRADGSIDEYKTQTELVPITDRADGSIDEYKTQTELVPKTDRASELIESDTGVTEVTSPAEIITEQKSGKTEGYSEIKTEDAGITEFSTESARDEFNKNITKMIRSVTIIEELEMATNKPNDSLGTKFESRETNFSESSTNKIDLTHPTEFVTETTDITEITGPKKSTTSNEIKFKGRKVNILEPFDILTEKTDNTESSVLEKIYRTASITNNTKFTTDNVNDQEFKSPKSENTLTTKLSGSSPTIIHISNTKQIDVESTLYDAKIDTQKTQAKLVPITDRASGSIESNTGITKVTSPTIIKTEPTFGTTESYSEIEHEISTELPSINEFSTGSIKLTTEGTQFSKNIITIIDPVTRVIEEMTTEKSGFKKPITLNTTEFESHQTNLSEAMTNKTDLTHPTEIPTTITETTESHRTAAMTNKTEMTFDYRTNKAIKDSTQDQPHTLKPSGTTPTIIDITQTEPIDVGNTVYHGKMNEYKTQTELGPITDRADGSIDEYKTQTELVPITDRADGSIDEYKTQTELVPITDRADGSIDENKTQTELVPITDRADGSIDENKTQTELVPITDRAGGSIDEYKTQTELVPNTDRASKLIESDTGVTEVISPAEIITEQKSGKTEGYSEITTEVAGITEFSTESVGTEFNKNITKMIRSVTIIEELEMATNKPNDSLGTKFESRKINLSESITNKIDLTHPTEFVTETTDITEITGPKKSTTLNEIKFKGRKVDILEPLDILTEKTDNTESSVLEKIYRTASITNNTEFTTNNVNDQEFKSPKYENTLTTKLSGSSPTITDISNTKQIDVIPITDRAGGSIDEYKTQTELVPNTDRASKLIESDTGVTEVISPAEIITEQKSGKTDGYSEITTEVAGITEFSTESVGTELNKNITKMIRSVTIIEELEMATNKPNDSLGTKFESRKTNLSEPITNKIDLTHPTEIFTETTDITEITGSPTLMYITNIEDEDVNRTLNHRKLDKVNNPTELVTNTDRASKLIESDTGVTEVTSPAEIITEQKSGKTEGYSEIKTEVAGITEFSTESVGTEFNKNITKMIRSVTIIEELEMATNKPNDSLGTKFESRKTNLSESITNKIDLTHPTEIFTETTDITEITGSPTLMYITNIEDEDVNSTLNHRKIDNFENQTELVPITGRASRSIESDTGTTEKTSPTVTITESNNGITEIVDTSTQMIDIR